MLKPAESWKKKGAYKCYVFMIILFWGFVSFSTTTTTSVCTFHVLCLFGSLCSCSPVMYVGL